MRTTIEIAVSENTSTTQKGRLLENLGKEVLETMQYDVVEEVRLTGMEVDLLAKHRITSEIVYVECKAYRETNTISSEVLTKLLGSTMFRNVSSGWLFSTGPLGKDAKGFLEEWENKPLEQRKMLHIYSPERLLDLIISSGKACNPLSVKYPSSVQFSETVTLLITNYGQFWAAPIIHVTAGIPHAIMLFDAKTGEPVKSQQTIDSISKIPSSFHELEWLYHNEDLSLIAIDEQLAKEAYSIVTVSAGDQWADYRPSRPQDFVGRDELLQDIFKFIDNVRNFSTSTRLLALKAPSGWGKSSVLLKLAEKSKTLRHRKKNYVYAVDVRAATSHRYAEFSLMECINSAIKSNFIRKPNTEVKISDTNNPLVDQSFLEIFGQLKAENKVMVLLFDQFEEIFSKKELFQLFESIRRLSIAVDSMQENLIIGFAWKTDGTVPTDHPAYYLWHGLADRRREFLLSPFVDKDINKTLLIFSKELGEPLNPILKKYLKDHCQGYPWLLKKLCIHVFSLVKSGIPQDEILGKGLNINDLFEKDTSELTQAEFACVKKVAQESPIELFQVVEIYGDLTVQSLINKRIILRKGQRLILYWDIFRDYILTGSVPHIPVAYIPQTQYGRYCDALMVLLRLKNLTLTDFALKLSVGRDTAENIVRDLVMIGNANRQGEDLKILQDNEEEAYNKIVEFFNKHILYLNIIEDSGMNFQISIEEFYEYFNRTYESSMFSETTRKSYTRIIYGWMSGARLIETKFQKIMNIVDHTISFSKTGFPISSGRKLRRTAYFLGEAPPTRVLELIEQIKKGATNTLILNKSGYRNSISLLTNIGGISLQNNTVSLLQMPENVSLWIAQNVMKTSTMEVVCKYSKNSPTEVGEIIAKELGKNWTISSQKRYGSALLLWYKWSSEVLKSNGV